MWIRTSDKKRIIFCGTVGKLETSKYKDRIDEVLCEAGTLKAKEAGYVLLNGECIGEYATEQRAVEVLDDICEFYEHVSDANSRYAGLVINMEPFVYYMPEE